MLPESWQKKLVDLNVEELKDEELDWADYVFLSSMYVQKDVITSYSIHYTKLYDHVKLLIYSREVDSLPYLVSPYNLMPKVIIIA